MTLENNIPKDVSDSISSVLGQRASLNLRRVIRVEIRPDKLEPKALVLSDHRLYIFANKSPSRLELSIHFLDLIGIQSSDNKLTFTTEVRKLKVFLRDATDVDHIVCQMADSLLQTFPHLSLESLVGKLEISPPDRLKKLTEQMKEKSTKRETGPCGNFSAQYRCMCDFHNMPFLDEVAWDVDTIYLALNNKALVLSDFDHLDGKHLVPIIATMAYNNWFTTLCGCDVRLVPEAQTEFANVTRTNTSIEHYCVMNCGLKSDFVQKLSPSLAANVHATAISHLLFNGNHVEDKGLLSLCPILSDLPKGATSLQFAKCNLTQKGVNKLAEALINNTFMLTSLRELDLSGNTLRDDVTNLYNFLATPNALVTLNLSGTECALDNIFGALIRGCCNKLEELDLSSNVFSSAKKKVAESMVPVSWKQFFASAVSMKKVSLADNKLPIEAIKNLLLGISSNENLREVALDLSNNNLGIQGGGIVETCMTQNTNITDLDISDNNLEGYLAKLLESLATNTSLKKLAIGKNFNNLKARQMQAVLEAVVTIMQEEDSALESLSLADSKLKADTAVVINALGGNTKLTELDISGNLMGDMGVRLLAKALHINNRLRVIRWDCNNTLPQGFSDVAYALQKNFTVQQMPIPVQDLPVALRVNREKTEKAIHSIESSLQRNNSPRRCVSEQAYRLQQSFLVSTTQEVVDGYIVGLLESIGTLERRGEELSSDVRRDIAKARALMKDAENSRQLLVQLQKIGSKCEDDGSDVTRKLNYMTDDLQVTLEKYLKNSVADMMKVAQGRCTFLMQDQAFTERVKEECLGKAQLPGDFSQSVLVHQAGPDMYNKLNEVNLTIAFHISEKLFEALLEALNKVQKELHEHITKGESELDRLARVSIIRPKGETAAPVETKASPTNRKSIYSVRARPTSHVASLEVSPTASGVLSESTDEDLDSFVFVDSDDVGKDSSDVTHHSDSEAAPAAVTPSSSTPKEPKSPPPKKPPPPKVVKAPSSQAGAKYVHQGKDFKPSPERSEKGKSRDEGEGEPSAPPRRKHHAQHAKKDADSSLERGSTISQDSTTASLKIEASPQLIAPPHVTKSAEKRQPPERPQAPERPPERPGERSSVVGGPKTHTAPPRPPPASRPLSGLSGSFDKSTPERPSSGHGVPSEKAPAIPERPHSQTDKPVIPDRPSSQVDKTPPKPDRPVSQTERPAKPKRTPSHAEKALERAGSQGEKAPVIPERPPPIKPARLSAAFQSPRQAEAAVQPPTEKPLLPVSDTKTTGGVMKEVSKDGQIVEKQIEGEEKEDNTKAKAVMIATEMEEEEEEEEEEEKEEKKEEPERKKVENEKEKKQETEKEKEDENEVSGSDHTPDLTDSLSTSVDSLLEESKDTVPSIEKSSPKIKPGKKKKEEKKKLKATVGEFDTVPALGESTKLTHLTKNRPRRMATAKPSRAVMKSEAYVIEDIGGADMDDFFGSKPVKKEVISRENSSHSLAKTADLEPATPNDEKSEAKGKKVGKPLFGGIDIFGGLNKFRKGSPKSPEDKPLVRTPEGVKKSQEPSAVEPASRKSPVTETEEEKEEAKSDVKPLSRRPPGAMGIPGLAGPSFMTQIQQKRSTMLKEDPKDKPSEQIKKEKSPQREGGETAAPTAFAKLRPTGRLNSAEKKTEDIKQAPPPLRPRPPITAAKPTSKPTGSPRTSQTKAAAPPIRSAAAPTRGSAEETTSSRPQSMFNDRSRLNELLKRDAEKKSASVKVGHVTENGKNNVKDADEESASKAGNKQFEVYL